MYKPHPVRTQVGILAVVLGLVLIGWLVMTRNDRRERDADPNKADRLQRSKESAEMFKERERDAKGK
jgi:hypothetical protein